MVFEIDVWERWRNTGISMHVAKYFTVVVCNPWVMDGVVLQVGLVSTEVSLQWREQGAGSQHPFFLSPLSVQHR